MQSEAITKFGQSLRGRLITRSDPDYDEARGGYYGGFGGGRFGGGYYYGAVSRGAPVDDKLTQVPERAAAIREWVRRAR